VGRRPLRDGLKVWKLGLVFEEFPEFSKSDESGKGALFAAQNLFSTIR
jgi:hypothetical protein